MPIVLPVRRTLRSPEPLWCLAAPAQVVLREALAVVAAAVFFAVAETVAVIVVASAVV